MKLRLLLLSLLIPAVLHAQTPHIGAAAVAANKYTVIPVLPYSITKPGTYVLLSGLSVGPGTPGITINSPGKVVLNLNGYGIGASEYSVGTGIVVQSSNVTIENGSLSDLYIGIAVGNPDTAYNTPFITGFVIHNVEFYVFSGALGLSNINGGNVYDCKFQSAGSSLGNDGSAISENSCENIEYSNISIIGGFERMISITASPNVFSRNVYIYKSSSTIPISAEPPR
jgi:hypothetical protein